MLLENKTIIKILKDELSELTDLKRVLPFLDDKFDKLKHLETWLDLTLKCSSNNKEDDEIYFLLVDVKNLISILINNKYYYLTSHNTYVNEINDMLEALDNFTIK